jgi:hypothetical protein
MLWYLEHELIKIGLTLEEVFTIIKASAWNKYRGRPDESKRLTAEISSVFSSETSPTVGIVDGETADDGTENDDDSIEPDEIVLENDTDLMSSLVYSPGWLINGFWTKKSHGIIAGEPKSFKSTLALDLAVSVASGRPFLNMWGGNDPGPVLMVQNENAGWIMKDRLNKIRGSKGLSGWVEIGKQSGRIQVQFAPQLPIYYINQKGINLTNPEHQQILIQIAKKIHPRLIIFDPLYLMFDGDVNQSKDLNPALTWLLSYKAKFDCALIIVHHWKKNTGGSNLRGGQRMLGSTTLHGWTESAWYIEVGGDKNSDESPTIFEGDEKEFASLNKSTGKVDLVLEREFRGAGIYPKVDLQISMGEFGSPDYTVKMSKHDQVKATKPKKTTYDEETAYNDLCEFMRLHKADTVSIRLLSAELGISRSVVDKLLEKYWSEHKGGPKKK